MTMDDIDIVGRFPLINSVASTVRVPLTQEMAAKDRERYEREMEEYERRQAGDMMIKDAGGAVAKEEPAQAGEEEKPSQGA